MISANGSISWLSGGFSVRDHASAIKEDSKTMAIRQQNQREEGAWAFWVIIEHHLPNSRRDLSGLKLRGIEIRDEFHQTVPAWYIHVRGMDWLLQRDTVLNIIYDLAAYFWVSRPGQYSGWESPWSDPGVGAGVYGGWGDKSTFFYLFSSWLNIECSLTS